jgi:hypothetical protein
MSHKIHAKTWIFRLSFNYKLDLYYRFKFSAFYSQAILPIPIKLTIKQFENARPVWKCTLLQLL